MDRAERKVMRKVGLAIGATALAATLLVLIFSYLTTRPLRRLIAGTAVVSTGNFDQPIIVRTRDELGDLAGAFNRMMVALKQYTGELARTTAEHERIQAELQFAREVQQGIVPRNFPPHERMEHVEIVAEIVPAREVGGDYYDFFPVDADHVGVVIADVSGKGLPAGLFMMLVRTLLRDNAAHNLSAGDAVARMNALAVRDNPSGMFVTLFYMICDMRTGRVVYTNAGHNLPILLKRDGPAMLEPAEGHGRGMVVGIMDNARYTDGEFTLAPGESILLFTDGVTEAFSADDRMFGDEGLREVAVRTEGQAAADRCRILVEEVLQFQKGREQSDDITVLFFKYLGMGDKVSGNS